ncbi:MAG: nucleoside hydrolase [Eubacteriales bacterium]
MEKIIFDCDNTMGVKGCDVDDGLALLYLLGKDSVELLAITTTYGNSDIETVYANTSKMLKDLDRTDIPFHKGCASRDLLESEATDYLLKTVNANQNNISILATGSLTNLYAAYQIDNTFFEQISEIVLMGGIQQDLIINGNIMEELNFSCDPVATACVLKNAKNLSIITGNNCLDAFFTKQEFEEKLFSCHKPIGSYIYQQCSYWFENMMKKFNLNGFHNWDVVAAAYLLNKDLFKDHYEDILLDLNNLKKGLLKKSKQNDKNTTLINIPIISNLSEFTKDVYSAWLEFDLK